MQIKINTSRSVLVVYTCLHTANTARAHRHRVGKLLLCRRGLITRLSVCSLSMRLAGLHSGAPTLCMSATLALRLLAGYGSRARCSADHRLSPQIRTAMAPSTQQLAVAAVAAAGCTAFVAAPSTARGPALRSATQGRAASSSSSSSSTLRHILLSFKVPLA